MKKIFVIIMSVAVFGSCAQNMQEPEIQNVQFLKGAYFFYCIDSKSSMMELPWDYPVKPGMEEWKRFQSNKEMTEACQIPESILSSLSTKELTAICLQYPLLLSMFAFNTPDQGIDALFNEFNGIRELFKRNGASKELLIWYNCQIRNCSLLVEKNFSDVEKGCFVYSIAKIEYLLSRATDNQMDILKNLVAGYETKLKYPDYFISGLNYNLFSRAHIIDNMCKQCFDDVPEKGYLFAVFYLKETIDIINKLSYQLIK